MLIHNLSSRVVVAVLGALTALALLSPSAQASTGGPATGAAPTRAVPSAATIADRMVKQPGVFLLNRQDEGPRTLVRGGLCTRLADLGCQQMVASDDAAVMVFANAAQARDYAGNADDSATAYGRMVLSFGSPARVLPAAQGAYRSALRAYRRDLGGQRPDAVGAAVRLATAGLLMRNAHREDAGAVRLGRAVRFPGAVSMVGSSNADVIVFATAARAIAYVGGADDTTYRLGGVVLSYGSPARVIPSARAAYERALRLALR